MQEIADVLARNATRISDLLRQWDTDCNGLIDRYEFRAAVKYLGIYLPYETVDALFYAWDTDGSGSLDYVELMMKARRAAFDRGFVPKNTVQPRRVQDKLNEYWARKSRTMVEAHRKSVEKINEGDRVRKEESVQAERQKRRDFLREKHETRRAAALEHNEQFWMRKTQDEARRARVAEALQQASEEEVVFLPRVPELRHLAKASWAKDPLRIRTPERREAADEVAQLPDVWVGKHVEQWQGAAQGTDAKIEGQFAAKLKGKVNDKHEMLHVGFAHQKKRQSDALARAAVGVQRRVGI